MRYTGARATGDAGAAKYNNLLQFRIVADVSQERKEAELKAELKKRSPLVELKPLPVKKISSVLVFAGTAGTENSDSLHLVKSGFAEATDEKGAANTSFWYDRIITIRLTNFDAQLVASALENHQSVMSFSYALYTTFSEANQGDLTVSGSKTLKKEISDFFREDLKNRYDTSKHFSMIKADVVNLKIDPVQWPQAIQKVDINEKVPAKYPLFDVYCYDFNNELRGDLYAKKIEIKATSVNGSDVLADFTFKSNRPDIYAKSIRFGYAVRFDKPFYYKVTEINTDGEPSATEWKQKREWSEILDITSTPDKVFVKPKLTDQ
jgi:hypothetical protein